MIKLYGTELEKFTFEQNEENIEVIIEMREDYYSSSMRVGDYGIWVDIFGAPRYQNSGHYMAHDEIVELVYNYIIESDYYDYYMEQIDKLEED